MAGRVPAEAVQNYVAPLQQIISCVCSAIVSVGGGYYARPEPHALLVNRGAPVRLQSSVPLWLSVAEHYRLIQQPSLNNEPWSVHTIAYAYAFQRANERELIAYHWHPLEPGAVIVPHLHLSVGSGVQDEMLQTAHLPTGPITLVDVIRFAIEELGARPRHDAWQKTLQQMQIP